VAAPDLRDEVTELTRELIRIDTSNPPGRETPAAELLAAYLAKSGIQSELVGPDPERLNLVARVPGGDAPSLLLVGHTDVVPAPPEPWSVPPFEGRVVDGSVIGRGAADMKGELAARAVALARIARGDSPPPGDVTLIAQADEERNLSDVGMSWLVRERPELLGEYALDEGGGWLLELADGRRVVTISVGEKLLTSLRIRVFGRAGHASVASGRENAVRRAATAVERLFSQPPPPQHPPAVELALERLRAPGEASAERIAWACEQHPSLAEMLPAMTRMTVTPTGLRTFEPVNVIPPYADVICDCRALPGQGEDDLREHIDSVIGGAFPYEVELLEPITGGSESPVDTPLYVPCEEFVAGRLPGAELLPLVTPGFSDSYWLRVAGEVAAYGFAPVFWTDSDVYRAGPHGPDESLAVADLVEMTESSLHAIAALGERADAAAG